MSAPKTLKLDSECYYGRHFFAGRIDCAKCGTSRDAEIRISARRWFNPCEGNTYHTVAVTMPTGETYESVMHYGHGQQFEHTAIELLSDKLGWDKEGFYGSVQPFLSANKHYASIHVTDVTRKRDL